MKDFTRLARGARPGLITYRLRNSGIWDLLGKPYQTGARSAPRTCYLLVKKFHGVGTYERLYQTGAPSAPRTYYLLVKKFQDSGLIGKPLPDRGAKHAPTYYLLVKES